MPELPEVETVRRGLAPVLVGKRVASLEARRPDLRFPFPDNFAKRVAGQSVVGLERRAKYLIASLSGGEDLVMHLGMTGRFTIMHEGQADTPGHYAYGVGPDPTHDHVVFHLSGGTRVVYNDPRRFGFMVMMARAERLQHPLFRELGAEPLGEELTADYLAAKAMSRKVNLKAFLMDQHVIAGLGNIYVSEALFQAGLSPNRAARSLADRRGAPTDRAIRLVPAIRDVLERAIEAGGSTLRDYRHADGRRGEFQERFGVYDRAGSACHTAGCGGEIRRAVHSGRATFYCPRCQR
ncbi:bifunctional DNA-formamidopyrimidine glycosylase/DNA-(apurinic or apyrimidinic site) lyase [Hyphomicrobium sp.]|uniref:bifunctional DNA-formamidopyrimidine glycosylase/DNA-(apurinic or apyrimidinic site) lyase n=1 Tax=Hyphomicrobium sp. TaxID=82 RepID=UPI002D76E4CD|nr:bifunctional DNA-formamidopyrimidine glycosylase/DNA-(apurinic or apyrimidinic site) lyase [Hyphomicrobium sp.]HET6388371.1 bifunctional DNA-formamidopyrimidine glycosylase/DNA-(apurinic or apyrimidinic site) lyase [Hyphomicrobium sp.]